MSRYRLVSAMEVAVSGGIRQRFRGGTTLADSVGNALAGDVVAPAPCATPSPFAMVALDAAAVAAFAAIGHTVVIGVPHALSPGRSTGVDSIAVT
jgi:hypothetical protein